MIATTAGTPLITFDVSSLLSHGAFGVDLEGGQIFLSDKEERLGTQ